jgi:hypothetical protein
MRLSTCVFHAFERENNILFANKIMVNNIFMNEATANKARRERVTANSFLCESDNGK